jgi:hypothetical protein
VAEGRPDLVMGPTSLDLVRISDSEIAKTHKCGYCRV